MTAPSHRPDSDPPAVGAGALRIIGAGSHGRIVIADSLSYCDERVTADDVVVGASFGGKASVVYPMKRGAKAVIVHDAGICKDRAGISGLPFGNAHGLPVAAVEGASAALSNGNSLYDGVISHANTLAARLGVVAGQSVAEAAALLARAPAGRAVDASHELDFTVHEKG